MAKPRILYLHQYFRTPSEGGAIRSYYLARALAENGWEVELITAHNAPRYECRNIEGIKVHYLPIFYDNKLAFRARIKAFWRFMWRAYRLALRLPKPDLVFATSTPLSVGALAVLLKWRKGWRYIFEVRDLWPQAPIEMGAVPNPLARKLLYYLEKKIYQQAAHIITLSPGMQAYVRGICPKKQISLLSNMSDTDFFSPVNTYKNTEFEILYAGTIGRANHLEYLLDIAEYCQAQGGELNKIRFRIVGEGSEKKRLQRLAKQKALHNLCFEAAVAKAQIRDFLAQAQAVYISFGAQPVLQTNSPNKFFDGLAAGRLCIVNTEGWLKDLVEAQACGFYANPKKPEEFAQKIQPFLEDEQYLEKFQKNARRLAESKFSRQLISKKFLDLLGTF